MCCTGLFFGWVSPLVARGARAALQPADLLPTPPEARPRAAADALWRHWTETCVRGRPSLFRAVAGAYGTPYYRLAVLKLFNDALTFVGAMLLNLLVQHLEESVGTAVAAPLGGSASACGAAGHCSGDGSRRGGGGSGGGTPGLLAVVLPPWCPGPGSSGWGYLLAALLGLSALAKAVIGSHYNYRLSLITVRLRAGTMGVLFRACLLNRAADAAARAGAADVNTLMAVDAGRLANLALSGQELWSLPLQIAAAMALLYLQVRTAFIAGLLLCVALIPLNRLIAKRIQDASVTLMRAKDARVGLMGELLRNIGAVKALGLEQTLGEQIRGYRASELSALALRKYLDALCVYFWAATQLLLSGTTFGLMVLLGQPLKPSVVFTSLALFNVLIAPLNAFPWVVNGVVEAIVSLRRIQAYLLLPQRCAGWAYPTHQLPAVLAFQEHQHREERQQQQQPHKQPGGKVARTGSGCCGGRRRGCSKQQQQQQQHAAAARSAASRAAVSGGRSQQGLTAAAAAAAKCLEAGAAAHFCNATLTWRQGQAPCLSSLNLSIPSGCLTAVVGEVGSGKSSLLAAILGELDLLEGSATLPHLLLQQVHSSLPLPPPLPAPAAAAATGASASSAAAAAAAATAAALRRYRRVGYVSQVPWLMRGSVRDNILLGQPYDAELMGEILHAVGLDTDLAAMPAGDLTPVGEGGAGLSGGQRLRVALARALYQPGTGLYLLDDLLASLDSHVAQWIIRHTLFGGLLSGCTVVVVTKHPAVIQAAQLVVGLEHGRIVFSGSPQGFANWKAQQACHGVSTGSGWSPLVTSASGGKRRGQQQLPAPSAGTASSSNGKVASSSVLPAPHPALADLLSPTAGDTLHSRSAGALVPPAFTGNGLHGSDAAPSSGHVPAAAGGPAAQQEQQQQQQQQQQPSLDDGPGAGDAAASEDVSPDELLLAGGRGVWALHASLSPQLTAILEEAGSSSLDPSGGLGELAAAAASSDGDSQPRDGAEAAQWLASAAPARQPPPPPLPPQALGQHPAADAAADSAAAVDAGAAAAVEAGAPAPQQRQLERSGSSKKRVSFKEDSTSSSETAEQPQQEQQQQEQQQQQPGTVLPTPGRLTPPPQADQQQQQQGLEQARPPRQPPQLPELPAPQQPAASRDEDEARAVGAVRWRVYTAYFAAVGWAMCGAVLLSLVLMQASKNGIDLWVTDSLSHSDAAGGAATAMPAPAAAAAGRLLHSCSAAAALASAGSRAGPAWWPQAGLDALALGAASAAAAGAPAPGCSAAGSSGANASCWQRGGAAFALAAPPPPPWQQQQRPATARRLLLAPAGAAAAPPVPRRTLRWRWAPLDPGMACFLQGLGIIAGLNTLATLARAFTFAAAGMAAARVLHERLLAAVLGAPLAFFDGMPAGRMLNRFSSDTSIVDDALPFILNILLANAVSLAGLLAVLLLSQPLLLAVLLPLGWAYRWLQLFYRSSARELRRLEALGLSPLYGLFGDTAAGAATLRAAAAQPIFNKCFLTAMQPYQAACVNNAAASNWLAARLQLLAAVLLSAVAGLAAVVAAAALSPPLPGAAAAPSTSTSSGWAWLTAGSGASWAGGSFRVDLLGLALAYCLPIVQLLNGLLTSSAETEQDMVGVERVAALLQDITPEEPGQPPATCSSPHPVRARHSGRESLDPDARQPLLLAQHGTDAEGAAAAASRGSPPSPLAIELVNVFMRYQPNLPPALRGVSFAVPTGHKLGVCGRTGAGKSSLLAALLRLRPISSGVIRVQGRDTATMSLRSLRARFGVVPQQPVLFSGSLRENLDPGGDKTDEQLAATLQAVHMWAPLCRVGLQRRLLSHSTYLMARRAGNLVAPGYQAAVARAASAEPPDAWAGSSGSARWGVASLEQPAVADDEARWLEDAAGSICINSRVLQEGAAAAVGAAAAAAALDAAADAAREAASTPSCTAARSGLSAVWAAAVAAVSPRWSRPQWSCASSEHELPPVPMHPAHKVLSMQVGGAGGLQLSAGQSQLVCLARMLLRGAPLVLLDEATAAVDPRTAALMHQVLHEQFDTLTHAGGSSSSSSSSGGVAAPCARPTVVQIAHELDAIMSYDAVLVMAGGAVVELGSPAELAAQEGSRFSNLRAQAGLRHGHAG